ncbi:MAG TPA: AgmX/PglI C-terminal domain-containing protein [Aggregicoccus sp.]|nr:AgmX/PglI C-terminal domain-containing protein [Aggregicoccus sp.]
MSGKSLLLWVVLPFLLLSAVGLWLTRGGRPEPAVPGSAQAPSARPAPAPGAGAAPGSAGPTASPPVRAPAPQPAEDPLTPGSEDEARVEAPAPGAADAGPPGTLDREALRAAVQAARPLLRQCFLDVTERYPGPQSVRLRFTLEGQGTSGRMRDAEVDQTSIQDPFLLACFVDALEDVQFPAPRGGPVTVTYPFRFRAARGAADAG